ncbi:MAG: transpeptidase family protein [Bacteroidales bacterium]|nr:transpeptidase family protein [Bacteroidales bacterium]
MRTYVIYFIVLIAAFAIIGKAAYIQLVEGDEWIEKAETLTMKYETVEPIRGNIYSSDGKLLAVSVPDFEIRIDVASEHYSQEFFDQKVDSLALRLSKLFGDRSKSEYKKALVQARNTKNRYYLLKRNVTHEQLKEMRTFPIFNLGKFRGGLIVIERTRREQPFKNLASRTIGWDKEGTENDVGLEGAYSEILSGVSGKRLLQRVGNGMYRPLNDEYEIEPQNGQDIITTIDALIQDVAYDALLKQMQAHEAELGCVVLMEVETGYIKAIVNLMLTAQKSYEERYNYAIAHSGEPGSTFKLASMLAAFEDNVVDLNDSIATGKGITYFANRKMEDSHRGGYGTITVQHAFEVSSNVAISKIINEYYKDKPAQFIKRLKDMSLNQPLGLEFAGEGRPLIKNADDKTWSKVTLPWMSIGYELTLTPLQTLSFYNAVANDGCFMKPLFVKEIIQTGFSVQKFDPVVINPSIASGSSIAKAQKMLLGVVENGTAKHLMNDAYSVAGKTGTAQIASGSAGYNKSDYQASFVGYFPANNPKYSMIVVISNPRKGVYYGAHIAAPVFREIADKVYSTSLEIQPETTLLALNDSVAPRLIAGRRSELCTIFNNMNYQVIDQSASDFVTVNINADTVRINDHEILPDLMPDVVGMSARDASYILERRGLRVNINGVGIVTMQSPEAGTSIDPSQEIILHLTI